MGNHRFYIRHLTLGIGIEMRNSPIIPTQHISQIACPPSCQGHTPANTAVQPRLSVPVAISCQHQRPTKGIDIRVGGLKLDARCQLPVMTTGLLIRCSPLVRVKLSDLIQRHLKIECMRMTKRNLHSLKRFTNSLQASRFVCTDVTIAMQFRLGYLTDYHPHLALYLWRSDAPYSRLAVRQGQHLHSDVALTPSLVFQQIISTSVAIGSQTIFRFVQRIGHTFFLKHKSDIPVMVFFDHRKDRTIRGFQSPVGIRTIKGTCITISAIFTDKASMTGLILLLTFHTNLVEVIGCRLNKVAYLLTLSRGRDSRQQNSQQP